MTDRLYIPPIKTQGIKTKLTPLIKNNVSLSNKSTWIEPFMGSGVVGFNIAPYDAIFADTNPYIIDFYNKLKEGVISSQQVRSYLESEGEVLALKDAVYYYETRERFNKYHDSLDFLFLNRSCFNGMMRFNKNLEYNVPYGHKPQRFSKAYITKIVNQVAHVEELIKKNNWQFLCQSFEQTIKMVDNNSFIYCDPPYIGRYNDFYNSWNNDMEIDLHDKLSASNTKFMLSTWDHNSFRENEYITKVWGECNKITQEHFYHVGAKESNRNPIVEALLTNYDTPAGDKNHLKTGD